MSGERARVSVSGDNIDTVAFFVDGDRVRRLTRPNGGGGRYTLSMSCARLRVGAHRARAVVIFEQGVSPARRTLPFRIVRSRQVSLRFTG